MLCRSDRYVATHRLVIFINGFNLGLLTLRYSKDKDKGTCTNWEMVNKWYIFKPVFSF